MNRRKLLFCGELPPRSVHGISISNSRILNILAQKFDIVCVNEKRNLGHYRHLLLLKIFRALCEGFMLVLKTVRWTPQIFYTSFPTSVFGSLKCLSFIQLYRLFGKGRVILHVHRGDLVSFYQRGRLPRFLVESCFDNSSIILALSQQQTLAYALITSTTVITVANSVDVKPVIWRPPTQLRLIYLSNYLSDKGLDTLLDAFKEVRKTREVELHCYGGGDSAYYVARIEAESIHGVKINGMLNEKDKFEVLQGFSLLVFPSYNEGQPLVILEAMAIGLPVVASAVGLISEMLGSDYPYLTAPRDARGLALAINACLSHSDISSLSKNLQDRFWNLYSPELQRFRVLEAFETIQNDNYED